MQNLHDIQATLDNLQNPVITSPEVVSEPDTHFEIKKIRLSRKQFAKK